MRIFDEYLEKIKLSGRSEPIDCSAYRFDHTGSVGNFRADAGVGTCNCCDYFTFDQYGNLILIEDTQLNATIEDKLNVIKNEKGELSFLRDASEEKKIQYVVSYIVSENVVKVYGSLFVFYKFLNMNLNNASMDFPLSIKSFRFWLVEVNVRPDPSIPFDNYKARVRRNLRGKLGREFVKEVETVPEDRLKNRLIRLGSNYGI